MHGFAGFGGGAAEGMGTDAVPPAVAWRMTGEMVMLSVVVAVVGVVSMIASWAPVTTGARTVMVGVASASP